MTKLYKLTDQNHETRNHTKWGVNVSHTTDGEDELCGPGWLHAYTSPLLAVLLNPIHANLSTPVLWEAKGMIGKTDRGIKVGCKKLTTVKILPLPAFTTNRKIYFAILCALHGYKAPAFKTWAAAWINGGDRSPSAAEAAIRVAVYAAEAAYAAAYAATYAAEAATYTAEAAAYTTYIAGTAADTAYTAYAADTAARAAARAAAHAAVHAAEAVPTKNKTLDLHKLALKAHKWKG